LGVDHARLQAEVEQRLARGIHNVSGGVVYTRMLKRVLEMALRESSMAGSDTVSTLDVLLALAQDRPSVASQALLAVGLDAETIRLRSGRQRDRADPAQRTAEESPDEGRVVSLVEARERREHAQLSLSAAPAQAQAQAAKYGDAEEPVHPVPRATVLRVWRYRLPRLLKALLLVQLLVFLALTAAGWGSLPARDAIAPRMERIGAPPGLIGTYASLSHVSFPVEHRDARPLATAAFAGTPADWGGSEPTVPTIDEIGGHPVSALKKLAAEISNTVLFVVPASALGQTPLYVAIGGNRYRLELVRDDSSLGFAVMSTAIHNHMLGVFASSLIWSAPPPPGITRAPLMLVRRNPSDQTYTLAGGTVDGNEQTGTLAAPVRGPEVGTPVIWISNSSSTVAGFVERAGRGPTAFVAVAAVVTLLRAVAPSVSGGS
jgi:hypothetical protein